MSKYSGVNLKYQLDVEYIGIDPVNIFHKVCKETLGVEAKRLGLISLDYLNFKVSAFKNIVDFKPLISVKVHMTANVKQSCVITLEPIQSMVDEKFELDFSSSASINYDFDVLEFDKLEKLEGNKIELGGLIMEHLVIALNPYPRKEGAKFEFKQDIADRDSSPFEILSSIK